VGGGLRGSRTPLGRRGCLGFARRAASQFSREVPLYFRHLGDWNSLKSRSSRVPRRPRRCEARPSSRAQRRAAADCGRLRPIAAPGAFPSFRTPRTKRPERGDARPGPSRTGGYSSKCATPRRVAVPHRPSRPFPRTPFLRASCSTPRASKRRPRPRRSCSAETSGPGPGRWRRSGPAAPRHRVGRGSAGRVPRLRRGGRGAYPGPRGRLAGGGGAAGAERQLDLCTDDNYFCAV
jgi:hypothetical protein